jgi:hypothetical protein
MKKQSIFKFLFLAMLASTLTAPALSLKIGRDIQFPKDYTPQKAAAIRSVIQNERFQFVDGVVSLWEPDFGTRLSFQGNAEDLNQFLTDLRSLNGIGLKVILYHGRDDESRRDSPWQLDFSQARPDQVAVYINVNSTNLDLARIQLPEWSPR